MKRRVLSSSSPAVLAPEAQVAARGLGARSTPPVNFQPDQPRLSPLQIGRCEG